MSSQSELQTIEVDPRIDPRWDALQTHGGSLFTSREWITAVTETYGLNVSARILTDAAGTPHLTDFGLAKDTRTESKYTRTGETLGTPAYMSPEQARGDLAQLTPATDTWALGCVLYEMLGGRPAFSGDSAAAVIGAILTGRFEHLPGIEPRAWELIAAALQASCDVRERCFNPLRSM